MLPPEIVQILPPIIVKAIETFGLAGVKYFCPSLLIKIAETDAKLLAMKTDADIARYNKLANFIRENKDLSCTYTDGNLTIDTNKLYPDLMERANLREEIQKIMAQQNIEEIIKKTLVELLKVDSFSDEPVSKDWMVRLFKISEDISDEQLQQIWARILAGEIQQPNSYSLRALETLRNMTKNEVLAFHKLASFALYSARNIIIYRDEEILKKYQIDLSSVLMFEECGLIKTKDLAVRMFVSKEPSAILRNTKVISVVKTKTPEQIELQIPGYFFTNIGTELLKAIKPEYNYNYIIDCLRSFKSQHSELDVSAHKIDHIDKDGNIAYEEENLLD